MSPPTSCDLPAGSVGSTLAACAVRRDPFLVLTAEEEDCNFVLAALLEERIRIVQFADEEPSLEEIFIRSTAGKVT